MRKAAALTIGLGLWIASPTFAHDTQPANWCPAGTVATVVSHFTLTPQSLVDYRAQRLEDGTVLGSSCQDPKSCGIVDDWHWANQAAVETCGIDQARKLRPGQTSSEQAMPFVIDPDDFNLDTDADGNGIIDHHDKYRFKSGLKGVCVVCRAPAIPENSDDADS